MPAFFPFLTVFNETFSKRFFWAGSLNGMVKSELTLLHLGALVGKLGKMKVPLHILQIFIFHFTWYIILIFQIVKLGKKWLAYFYRLAKTKLDTKFHVSNSKNKPPAQKKHFLKVSLKTVKNWKKSWQIRVRACLPISPFNNRSFANCSAFGSSSFFCVSFSRWRKNWEDLRENLKHKIQT